MSGYLIVAFCFFMFCSARYLVAHVVGYFPDTPDEQPWVTISGIAFYIIFLVPIISAFLPYLLRKFKPKFAKSEYSAMYLSSFMLLVMILAWIIMEMSLHWTINIRIDRFLIYPAFIFQLILIAVSKPYYKHGVKNVF